MDVGPKFINFGEEVAKYEGLVKEVAISDVMQGYISSCKLRLVTLEDCEYMIQWDAKEGLNILSTK